MSETGMLKGQRVNTPVGQGEVVEIVGEKVTVKLDSGQTETFSNTEVSDDSNAG